MNKRDTTSRADLQEAYRRAGDLLGNPSLFHLGRLDEAQSYQSKALTIARSLADRDPRNAKARSDLSIALRRLAAVLRASHPSQAVQLYAEAIALLDSLLAGAPGDLSFRRDLANARLGLGIAHHIAGAYPTALAHLRTALSLQQQLIQQNPERIVVWEDMLDTHLALGDAYAAARDISPAIASYQEALKVAYWLVEKNKSRLYAERCLALAFQRFGHFRAQLARYGPASERQRHRAEATHHLNNALRIWTRWRFNKLAEPYASHRERELLALMRSTATPIETAGPAQP